MFRANQKSKVRLLFEFNAFDMVAVPGRTMVSGELVSLSIIFTICKFRKFHADFMTESMGDLYISSPPS